jgi:endonuclease YncB( thermonuclease family)
MVGVSDGDTITARCGTAGNYEQIKVRLNGIDASEKRQPFGQRAKDALSDLVSMKEAALDCPKTDRYGRSVCKVMWLHQHQRRTGPRRSMLASRWSLWAWPGGVGPTRRNRRLCGHKNKSTTEVYIKQRWRETA